MPVTLGIDIGGTAVKMSLLRGDEILWTERVAYHQPSGEELLATVRTAAAGRAADAGAVGLCVPGLLDEKRERVTYFVNVPGLMDVRLEEIAAAAIGRPSPALRIVNDTLAAAFDLYATRKLHGRMLLIALGSGVGIAVLDGGVPLSIDGDSPGHLGQCDVALESDPPIGPDSGAGSLEAYIGIAAMKRYYGDDAASIASKVKPLDPSMRALVRAIRICHAIYRPDHIILAGGLGVRLGRLLPELRAAVEKHLTRLSRPIWTMTCADHDFHAAHGAARLADDSIPLRFTNGTK